MWSPDPAVISTAAQREADALSAAWVSLRAERDRRIVSTNWAVERHADELMMARGPTLSPEQFDALMGYRQALRDITAETIDPLAPEWPAAPL